jgi:uncharacterized protein (DUF2164 family)
MSEPHVQFQFLSRCEAMDMQKAYEDRLFEAYRKGVKDAHDTINKKLADNRHNLSFAYNVERPE